MPVPPLQTFPASTAAASVRDVPEEGDAESVQSMSRPVSLYEQHIADFPRIHRPVPCCGRILRCPSPAFSNAQEQHHFHLALHGTYDDIQEPGSGGTSIHQG